ncbi:MAG: hypothetical protein ABIJ26_03770 [Candidatus Margulisiibacteriota bacterium]
MVELRDLPKEKQLEILKKKRPRREAPQPSETDKLLKAIESLGQSIKMSLKPTEAPTIDNSAILVALANIKTAILNMPDRKYPKAIIPKGGDRTGMAEKYELEWTK